MQPGDHEGRGQDGSESTDGVLGGQTRELIAALALTEDQLRADTLTPDQRQQLRAQQKAIVYELRRRRAALRSR